MPTKKRTKRAAGPRPSPKKTRAAAKGKRAAPKGRKTAAKKKPARKAPAKKASAKRASKASPTQTARKPARATPRKASGANGKSRIVATRAPAPAASAPAVPAAAASNGIPRDDAGEPDFGQHLFDLRHPHGRRQTDDVGERMAESTLRAITGEHDGDFEESDNLSVAETGGPFVETSAEDEFGYGDGGLPEDTEPSALPVAFGEEPANPEDALDEDEE